MDEKCLILASERRSIWKADYEAAHLQSLLLDNTKVEYKIFFLHHFGPF
jgi:hypothetical protein